MQEEAVIVVSETLSRHLSGEAEEIYEIPESRQPASRPNYEPDAAALLSMGGSVDRDSNQACR
jgi:hypothetical protein